MNRKRTANVIDFLLAVGLVWLAVMVVIALVFTAAIHGSQRQASSAGCPCCGQTAPGAPKIPTGLIPTPTRPLFCARGRVLI